MEEKDIGFGMVDSHKDVKVAKKLGGYENKAYHLFILSSIITSRTWEAGP